MNALVPEIASGWIFNRQYAGDSYSSSGYRRWGDKMSAERYQGSTGNTAVIATNYISAIINQEGVMTDPQKYALVVLHIMGHNAGLAHDAGTPGNWFSPMSTGNGLQRRIKDKFTFDDVVFGNTMPARIFRSFVTSYFNPTVWNGNPNNSLFLMDFMLKNNSLDIFFRFGRNDYKRR